MNYSHVSTVPDTAVVHNKIMPYREPLFELLVERDGVDIFLFEGDIPDSFEYPDAVSKVTKTQLVKQISRGGYDVVVNPDVVFSETYINGLVAAVSGMNIVQWTETWSIPTQTIRERYRMMALLRVADLFADAYVVPGVASGNYVKEVTSTTSELIYRMGSPTHMSSSSRYDATTACRIPDDDIPTVLFLGQVTRRKGVDTLLDAFARLSEQIDCRLVIGGKCDPSYCEELETQIEQYDLDDIIFLGWVPEDELFACYAAADVYALPSRADPWAISVVEAMKAGTPVVVSNAVGAAWDLVDGQETGYIIPVNDPSALANRLLKLLSNPEKKAAMGKRAAELVTEKMTYDQMATNIENAIKKAVSGEKGV